MRRYRQMYDRLQETPVYKEMVRLASEKVRAEALEEAKAILEKERQEIQAKALRETLLALVEARFPKMSRLTRRLISTMSNAYTLQTLILKISMASTIEEARQRL